MITKAEFVVKELKVKQCNIEAKTEGERDGPLTCISKQSGMVSISQVSGQDSSALDVSGEALMKTQHTSAKCNGLL